MSDYQKPYPKIEIIECKACSRCVASCPKKVLQLGEELNERGYNYVHYKGEGCIGCGNCFYTCPEPNAMSVVKKD